MTTLRGPLSTMVEVQSRTKAESEMAIASRLVLLEATALLNDGDCDSDGFVEPLEYVDAGGAGPTGGGFLPNSVASARIDPWGVEYGYCGWDAGPVTDALSCDEDGSTTNERLDGTADGDETYTVIAVISAGPDQVFDTTCVGGVTPSVTTTGDDLVVEFTYQTATAATDGLWNIQSGNPGVAEISKDLDVSGGATFSGGIDLTTSTAALQLGAASMVFPDNVTLPTCNGANVDLVRLNRGVTPVRLEICDGADWVSAGGSGLWLAGAGNDIYYNSGTFQVGIGTTTPGEALDVVGNIDLTGNLTAGGNLSGVDITGTGNAAITGTLGVTGATTLSTLTATGAVDFDSTLNTDGAVTFGSTLGVTGATTLSSTLDAQGTISNSTGDVNIGDNIVVTGTSDLQGNVSSSVGDLTLDDAVDITGALDAQGAISNSTGNLNLSDDTDITGALTVSNGATVTGNISATGSISAGTVVNVNGDQLGPPLNCTSSQKLSWANGVGWSCATDLQGGSGGGVPALDDLTDVSITAPANDDCLLYNNVSGDWENGPCSVSLSAITDALANNTISNGEYRQTWQWALTNNVPAMTFGESLASTGANFNQYIVAVETLSGSTATPLRTSVQNTGLQFGLNMRNTDITAGSATGMLFTTHSTRYGKGGLVYIRTADPGLGDFAFLQEKTATDANSLPALTDRVMTIKNDGDVIIGTDTAASLALKLDVAGQVGATEYCDENGLNCFTALSASSDVFEVTGGAGSEVVRQVNSVAPTATSDFVFGSSQLDDTGAVADDIRMFFDKTTGAFRAGGVDGTQWDSGSRGIGSAAFGVNTIANANGSVAFGLNNTASGGPSFASGFASTASGFSASSIGFGTAASGTASVAMGTSVIAGSGTPDLTIGNGSGNVTFAIGLQTGGNPSVTPMITGDRSMGLFFDRNVADYASGYDLQDDDMFALIGGTLMLEEDPQTPASRGCIRFNDGTDRLQFSNDCSTYVNLASPADGIFERNGTVIRGNATAGYVASTDDFVFGSSQLADTGVATDDARMFFDKSKGAFRVGTVTGTEWDDGNVGVGSVAIGNQLSVTGLQSFAIGADQVVLNDYSIALGYTNAITGSGSLVLGGFNGVSADFGIVLGIGNTVSSANSVAIGNEVKTSTGTHQMALGLADQTDTDADRPVVTGSSSLGIFMDQADNYDLTDSDMMALIGGQFMIDSEPSSAASRGCIQYDDTADELQYSDDCSTYVSFADIGAGSIFELSGTVVRQIAANAPLATSDFLFGTGTAGSTGAQDTFLFFDKSKGAFRVGSITDAGGGQTTNWDDAQVGASSFASGNASRASGAGSFAHGYMQGEGSATIASGSGSVAFGSTESEASGTITSSGLGSLAVGFVANNNSANVVSSGTSSFAMGRDVEATGNHSLSFGETANSSGLGSIVFGNRADASGDYAVAFGLSSATHITSPIVSGDRSVGFFMDQATIDSLSGIDLAASDTFAIIGGDFIVGSYQLDDTTTGSQDFRMFFDRSKGAFRAGAVVDDKWNDANVGAVSAAFNGQTIASGAYSTATGRNTAARGQNSIVAGFGTTASGATSSAFGINAVAGSGTAGDGAGDFSVAFGLQSAAIATNPVVTGDRSMVLFFDGGVAQTNSGYNFTATDKFALIGGELMIDSQSSSAASRGCIRYNDTDDELQYSDDCSTYVSFADISSGTALSDITAATASNSINNSTYNQTWNWQLTAAGRGITFAENAASTGGAGDQSIVSVGTLASSTATPLLVSNLGNALSFQVSDEAADTTPFVIDAAGNVGVGVAAPLSLVHIAGTPGALASGLTFGDGDTGFYETSDDTVYLNLGVSGQWRFESGRFYTVVGAGPAVYAATDGNPQFAPDNTDPDSGFGRNSGADTAAIFSGGNVALETNSSGNVGLGDFSSDTIDSQLHVLTGDIRLDGGAANEAGCIRFDDTDDELQYSDDCSTYTAFADLGGGSGVFEVTGGAGTELVRQVAASAPLLTSDFVFGSTQLADTTNADHDNRMFFDKSKGAFRAGGVNAAQWDDASVGLYSQSLGLNTTASGIASLAFGATNTASGNYAISIGSGNTASATASYILGGASVASQNYAMALGSFLTTDSVSGITMGNEVKTATGTHNMALGLSDQTDTDGNRPVVTGSGAFGIFMDQADSYTLATDDVMALIGGELMIDSEPSSAASRGCIRFNDTSDRLEYSDNCSAYTSFTALAGGVALNQITDAEDEATLTNGKNKQTWLWELDADGSAMTFGEASPSANGSKDQYILTASTLDTSTATPLYVENLGDSASFQVDDEADDTSNFVIHEDGDVSIGSNSMSATLKLDVEGSVGATQYCNSTGTNCFTPTSASTGLFERNGTVIRGHTTAGYVVATDDFVFGSTQLTDSGNTNEDSRMFFDKSAGAFRAGSVTGTAWDAPGSFSAAMGLDNTASGTGAIALGGYSTASSTGSIAMGLTASSTNIASISLGTATVASGLGSVALGDQVQATANNSVAIGVLNIASGVGSTALGGGGSVVNGIGAFAAGTFHTVSGLGSTALGNQITVGDGNPVSGVATNSMGIGLGSTGGTKPAITGSNSLGIFMGDHNGRVVDDATTMAVVGGDFVVGSTQLADLNSVTFGDNRMFFDISKGAFRAGSADSTQWDDASVGTYSVAIGRQVQATQSDSIALGGYNQATGTSAISIGTNIYAQGTSAVAIGEKARAIAVNSMAIGLSDESTSFANMPQVNGAGSLGVFMEGDTSYNLSATNTFGVIGGRVLIDSTSSLSGATPAATIGLYVVQNAVIQGTGTTCTIGNGTGATSCTSDIRLKENITPIEGVLEKIDQIEGVYFTWKDKEKDQSRKIGVIAQEIEKVFPEVIDELEDGTKTVDYAALVSPLIQATKELKSQNAALRAEQKQIRDAVAALTGQVNVLNKVSGREVSYTTITPLFMLLVGALIGSSIAMVFMSGAVSRRKEK
ncbi:MAG: hypothetical protein GC137_10060 [Alphaproteobacteria bacterium]|nr:hypothetical protein [Alphaproteobacteria bacterium]